MEGTIEDEEEEDADIDGHDTGGTAGSREGLTDEGNLGESWKTTRAGAVDDYDDDQEHEEGREKGAGVLGLIYQFQKAQADGRSAGAAGVNI